MAPSWLRRLFAPVAPPVRARTFRPGVHHLEDRITPYNLAGRLTATATNPGPLKQGDATVVTWGFIPDGTTISGSEGTSGSVLIQKLDALFGSGPGGSDLTLRPWFNIFNDAYTRLGQVSGLQFVYEPKDDGATFANGSPGVLGVRADERIGGHAIDGGYGVLAYNYYPGQTDMVIDTDELEAGGFVFDDQANNNRAFRNMLMHETGHGIGLQHEMPDDGTVMMNPQLSTGFEGPQFDDILGMQRLYGDPLERNGGNDTLATATPLGLLPGNGTTPLGLSGAVTSMLIAPTTTDFLSIDGKSDADVFQFAVLGGTTVDVKLNPVGFTYLSGAQGGPAPTPFDALGQSDLRLELLDATGAVVATQNVTGLGQGESVLAYPVPVYSGGTFYARVTGTQDVVQLYKIGISNTVVTVPAVITRDPAQPAATNAAPVRFDVNFAHPVIGFNGSSVGFGPGTLTAGLFAVVTPNGTAGDKYFVDVYGANGTGTIGIDIAAGAATSATFGVLSLAATTPASELVTFDNAPPVATFTPAAIGLTAAGGTAVTLAFSEPVTAITASALQLINATVANFTRVNATTYTFDLKPTADGPFSATLPSGAAADPFGNPNNLVAVDGTSDGTPPAAVITPVTGLLTRTGPVAFRVQFSEPLAAGAFTASDVAFAGSTVGGTLAASIAPEVGVPNAFRVTVTGMTGSGTVVVGLPAGAVTDPAGNPNPAATATTPIAFDEVPPTASFNPPSPFLTNGAGVPVTLSFSEPVTGFDAADLVVAGGAALSSFQAAGDGKTYTLTLDSAGDGAFTVTVPAGVGVDAAGNNNLQAVLTGAFDTAPPGATISRVSPALIRTGPAVFRVQFTEAVAAFTPAMVSTAGSTVGGNLTVSVSPDAALNTYLVRVSGMTGTGTVRVGIPAGAVTDVATNPLPGAVAADSDVAFDGVAPTATLASVPAGQGTVRTDLNAAVTVSEPVTGLSAGSFAVTGPASIANFQAGSDGLSYTFTLARTADGPFTVTLPAAATTDVAGNPNAATSLSGTFDSTGPTTAVTPTKAGFTDTAVSFNVTYGEALRGAAALTADEVTFGGTARPKSATVTSTGARTFLVTVSGMVRTGTVTVQVPGGAVADVAGNPSAAASGRADYTSTAPPPENLVGTREFATGSDAGSSNVDFFNPDGSTRLSLSAFDAATTGVRVAAADFTRDGIADLVVGTGPGSPSVVRILDGRNGSELLRINPFEAAFTGGVFVAAGDLDGDGVADLVVTPDQGGGPRVQVYRIVDFAKLVDFFGIEDPNFRGGARAAVGDLNGDGRADLVVSAGFGGGPRIAAYEGKSVGTDRAPQHLFNDLFVFEQSLRNGVYVAAGDVDGDGFADLVIGGGPGGAPRVMVLSGQDLSARNGGRTVLANFFAGDTSNRDGVRVAVKNLDDDGFADLLVGPGTGAGAQVTSYLGKNLAAGNYQFDFAFDALGGATNGVFVG